MILELVASRVLSPYFGSSNIVWTSVIGIILLSGSLGNYFGGIIADREKSSEKLKWILIFTFIAIIIIPFIDDLLIENITSIISNVEIGAVISTFALFFAPSLFIGLINPIIVKLKLKDMESAGRVSGRITAIATIGGIFGTFLGGFVLLSSFGCIQIIFILSIIILLLIPLVDCKIDLKNGIYIILIIIIILLIILYNIKSNESTTDLILDGEIDVTASFDTQYGRVIIYNKMRNNELVRILNVEGGYESATYVDEDKYTELVFEYTKYYDLMFNSSIEIIDTLMIGGAGYSYPKYFLSHFEDKNMDVVEIDGEITEIAKKYFYLDKLIDEYNLENSNRFNNYTEDGRIYLNNNIKKYDAILNDAFSGKTPAEGLTTLEAIQAIKNSLNENGVYLTNIIASLEGDYSKFLRAEVNTLKQVFEYVYIVPCNYDDDLEQHQNLMVIATDDDEYTVENNYEIELDDDEIILTDDYCPIDSLIVVD